MKDRTFGIIKTLMGWLILFTCLGIIYVAMTARVVVNDGVVFLTMLTLASMVVVYIGFPNKFPK